MTPNRTVEDAVDQDDLDQIKEEIHEQPETVSFNANRTPIQISNNIKDLADREFAGDYGMALTFLWKEHEQKIKLDDRIDRLEERVERLSQKLFALVGGDDEEEEDNGINVINDE